MIIPRNIFVYKTMVDPLYTIQLFTCYLMVRSMVLFDLSAFDVKPGSLSGSQPPSMSVSCGIIIGSLNLMALILPIYCPIVDR